MDYTPTFFYSRKNLAERIEDEIRPLENILRTMLEQKTITSETREKINKNLTIFSTLRTQLYKKPSKNEKEFPLLFA